MPAKNIFKIEVEDLDTEDEAYRSSGKSGKKGTKSLSHKTGAKASKPKVTKLSAVEAKKEAKDIFAEKVQSWRDEVPAKAAGPDSLSAASEKTPAAADAANQKNSLKDGKKTKLKPQDIEDKLNSDGSAIKDIVAAETERQENDLEQSGERIHTRRSIRTYRRIAYFFVALTVLLLAGVFYFTAVSVDIVLVPEQERLSNNMIFDIKDSATGGESSGLGGVVREVEVEESRDFPVTGEEIIGQEAVGTVTIENNYSKNQPLVATTRLIPVSDPDKLYRTANTVNVPAGGSVQVEIYADEASPEMAIGPTKFTIPGLWAGLQDKIFATSDDSVVYRQKVEKYLTKEDIDNASKELKQLLLIEAKQQAAADYAEYNTPLFKINEESVSYSYEGEIGDRVDTFAMNMSADVVVVAFKESEARSLAEQKFAAGLPQNKEVVNFDKESLIYALNNYDLNRQTATVNATFEGRVSLSGGPEAIDVDNILGLSRDQLYNYLDNKEGIADYRVEFNPGFLPGFLQRVPSLKDKVNIELSQ